MVIDENNIYLESFLYDSGRKRILIMYPYKFKDEKILQDNIIKMKKVIIEYIDEVILFNNCINAIDEAIWDSKKELFKKEAEEHERKISELSEIMNNGISPYKWYFEKVTDEYSSIFHNHDYAVYLDKIQEEE